MIYKPAIDIRTTNDLARLGKSFKMFIIFPFLAILLPTVFCENDLRQTNPELSHQLQRYENQPLLAKPCNRRFFPNPVIDTQWVPSLPPAQNLQANNGQRRSKGEDSNEANQVERSQSNPGESQSDERNASDQSKERSAEDDDDLRESQRSQESESGNARDESDSKSASDESDNRNASDESERRNANDESDSNRSNKCDYNQQANQQEEQQYYRRSLSNARDSADDRAASKSSEEDELANPVERSGVSSVSETRSPFHGSRVCYACTSASNPHCLHPNKQTTVKYCHPHHDSCVTKTYKNQNGNVVIRDCASSCRPISVIGVEPKYKSCKLCHSDLCNSAAAVTSHALLVLLFIGTLLKCIKSNI